MRIYLSIICVIIVCNLFGQTSLDYDSISKVDNKFYYKNKLFTGIIISKYHSGKIKSKWEVNNGYLNGKVIGFYDEDSINVYSMKYQYNYLNGIKIGEQFEYYKKSEELPNYNRNSQTITDFDNSFFGNRDGNYEINFYQKEGCSIKRDTINNKTIFPSNESCPSGKLNVFYEGHDGPGKLFTKCYGSSKCFWRSFKRNGTWWFD